MKLELFVILSFAVVFLMMIDVVRHESVRQVFKDKFFGWKCKIGKHAFGRRYRCFHCDQPRKHPQLKFIAGEKKSVSFFKS